MTKRLMRLAIWAVWVGVIALGLAVAWSTYEVTDDKPVDFLAQFGAPTLALCVAALEVALIWRRWLPATALVATVGALVFALQGQWFPPNASPGEPNTRIYFANIWDENRDIGRAARSVADANPDVAAMVEFADQHRAAQMSLFPDLPYRVLSPGNPAYAGKPGAVIAARWPLTPLKAAATWNFNILAARVEEPGAPFRLIVVHLTRPWPFRRSKAQAGQVKRLMQAIEEPSDVPTVVVGDFNATTSGYLLKELMAQENLRAAPAMMGDWPSNLPGPFRIAIENAFTGTGATILNRRLGKPTGSDHRPIIFEIAPTKAP